MTVERFGTVTCARKNQVIGLETEESKSIKNKSSVHFKKKKKKKSKITSVLTSL